MADKKNIKPDEQEVSAVASRDLYENFVGDVIENPDQVVAKQSSGLGLKLYEDMESKDGHIRTVIGARKLAVVCKEWNVESASDDAEDVKRAEFVEQVFKNFKFDKARKGQLDAIMKGFAVSEIIWDASEGDVVIKHFKHRKPWRFAWSIDGNLKMLTDDQPVEGEIVPREKFWVSVFDQKYESQYGRPLGETLFWPYWFKKQDIKWWLIFNEKFGSPTPVGKFPSGTSKEKQEELLKVIVSLQQETGVVIPEGMAIELMEASRRGSVDTYKEFVDWAENLQSKIVLGQTLTTQQGDSGAFALGKVHENVKDELTKADCDDLCESLNEDVIRQLVDFNFPQSKNGYPKLWIRTEMEKDLKPLAERDKTIYDMGFNFTQEYIKETYDVDVVPRAAASAGSGIATFADPAAPSPDESQDGDDNLKSFVERAVKQVKHDKWINVIVKEMELSKDLLEFKERLHNVSKDMDVMEQAELMQQSLEVAHLIGAFEALAPDEKETPLSPPLSGGENETG